MAKVHVTVPDQLKEEVADKMDGSSFTYSQLMKSAMKKFVNQYEKEMQKLVCCPKCGENEASIKAWKKLDCECQNCGYYFEEVSV